MSVEKETLDYLRHKRDWARVRALMSGADAARAEVRRLPGHDDETFALFAAQAYYLPAVPRTIESFGGMLFFKQPAFEAADALAPYLADLTLDGTSAARLTEQIVDEVLEVGRCAVLVDHPPAPTNPDGSPLSVAQAQAQNLRAFARLYRTEDVLGVRFAKVGGARVLSQVRLREEFEDERDEFEVRRLPAVRVLDLFDDRYRQRLFVKSEASGTYELREEVFPIRRGEALREIPITFFRARDHDAQACRPPLADLAEVSVAHLNASARTEWALMWCGNPTPCFKGLAATFDADPQGHVSEAAPTVRLGSSEGLSFQENGDAWFLELEGKAVDALRQDTEDKRRDLATLGARILMDDPRAAVAADALKIQRSGEHSILGGIAGVVSEGMARVLRLVAAWDGLPEEVSVRVNTDFIPTTMSPLELKELVAAVQGGLLSTREFFARLQRGGLVREDKSYEEHAAELEEDGGALLNRDAPAAA